MNLPAGNTGAAALKAKELPGSIPFKIDPVEKYTVDYPEYMQDAHHEPRAYARSERTGKFDGLDGMETVIRGSPNWRGTMLMPVPTNLGKHDFPGKTILSLCAHEGSGMGTSKADIRNLCPGVTVKRGLAIQGGSVKDADSLIADWLKRSS